MPAPTLRCTPSCTKPAITSAYHPTRHRLDTNAGSDDAEENAVCYLQVLLAGHLLGMGRARMFADMDAWGYSFRLGSSRSWFEADAEDARQWLLERGLIDQQGQPGWKIRCTKSITG